MNDRERLIEILDTAKIKQEWRSSTGRVTGFYHAKIVNGEYVKPLVELLIANGVTVQKHGRWDTTEITEDWLDVQSFHHVHKECKYAYADANCAGHNYCPNCGAKMDGEANGSNHNQA